MKKLLPVLLALIFIQCTSTTNDSTNEKILSEDIETYDPTRLIYQYWELQDAENPTQRDINFTEEGISYFAGLLLFQDSVILENPKAVPSYGTYTMNQNEIKATYKNGRKATYQILNMDSARLLLKRTDGNGKTKLIYKATHTYWPDVAKNPFSEINYAWTKKPSKPESEAEIHQRAKDCVRFYAAYFKGIVDGKAKKINFDGLPNCFEWYVGGIYIQSATSLNEKFISCFYNKSQALQARQMLEDALGKKYDWDEKESNWVNQTAKVLVQIYEGM